MGILDIDHVMCLAKGIDETREAYEHLGFTVSSFSRNPALGGGNHCVLFPKTLPGAANYLELVSIEDFSQIDPTIRDVLGQSLGGKMLVLSTDDVEATAAEHSAYRDIQFGPVSITRDWEIEQNKTVEVSFSVYVPSTDPANVAINACEHHSAQHYIYPPWTNHRNGAQQMTSVLIAARDMGAAKDVFAIIPGTWQYIGTRHILQVQNVALEIMSQQEAFDDYGYRMDSGVMTSCIGVKIAAEFSALETVLGENGIAHTIAGDIIRVGAADAVGLHIDFEAT